MAEEAGGKSSTERLVEHFDGVVVRVVTRNASGDHANRGLVYVFLLDEVVTWRGRLELNVFFLPGRTSRPSAESRAQLGFHGGRIEVSHNAKNDVVGMHPGLIPVQQILARDGGDGGVLLNPG